MTEILRRPAARVVCFDPAGRVLLMNWRDPVSGRSILEPPGGGIEPGESAIEAARREWTEEIGRSVELREDWAIDCEREIEWAGRRIHALERFFGAWTRDAFEPDPSGFTSSELVTYLGAHWVTAAAMSSPGALAGDLEPLDLAAHVERLAAMRGAASHDDRREVRSGPVKVEILYFEGCPNYRPVLDGVRELLSAAEIDAEIASRQVQSEQAARELRFLGSPTVRVDGRDVEPGAATRSDYGLKCRIYQTPDGITGRPSDEWILATVRDLRPSAGS